MPAVVYEVDMWLMATTEAVPADEVRRHWKAKESAVDELVDRAPRLWLGVTRVVTPEEPHAPGAAGRLSELLALRGTTPDYVLPELDERLERELVAAFGPRPGDDLPAASLEEVVGFLARNRGARLFTYDWLRTG